jgi:cell division septal protein FtsQ
VGAVINRIYTLKLLVLAGLVFSFNYQALAANKISDNRVTLDSPVSAAEVISLRALKSWPGTTVQLDKTATDEVLGSLRSSRISAAFPSATAMVKSRR